MRLRMKAILVVLIFTITKSNYTSNVRKNCRCVSIFLCYEETHFDDAHGDLDFRSVKRATERKTDDCHSELEVCCEPEKILRHEEKQTSDTGCGIRNIDGIDSRITSSYHKTQFAEFPWMIAVLHNSPEKQDVYLCDGALIHRKVVLTAAHCVDRMTPSKIKIRAGEWNTQAIDESLPHQDRGVETIRIHGNYSSRLFHNDIALLILSRSLQLSKHVNVICLPESISEVDTTQCIVSGWSRKKLEGPYETILKKMDLQMVSRTACQKVLRSSYRSGTNFLLDKSLVCASERYGNNVWKADGGSPLVCPLKIDNRRYVQTGVSVPNIGRSIRILNVFANVLLARAWIDEQLLFYNLDNTEYQYVRLNH